MSLDPIAYSLDRVLEAVWADNTMLSNDQKELIAQCLPQDTELNRPSSETDLDYLQQVLAACEVLNSRPLQDGLHWLSPHGMEFPTAIHKYVHSVATKLFKANRDGVPHQLPIAFVDPLCAFIKDSKSHVATLNYDGLLDKPFSKQKLVDGANGVLIDGVFGTGFIRSNLFRNPSKDHGWFFHLHGSPLYYDDERGNLKKLKSSKMSQDNPVDSSHLVLTHVRHKPTVIASSNILTTYWEFLQRALEESEEVILFGYSGEDDHLNELVASGRNEQQVRIIEWIGAGTRIHREAFWKSMLHDDTILTQMESVFEFIDW